MQKGGLSHVNDLGFAWTGWPSSCMDRPSSLFLQFFCQVVCHALQRHTAPCHCICPCFWRKHFYTPLFLDFLWNANFRWAMAGLLERLPNNSGNKGINVPRMHGRPRVCCGMWLGGQPRVRCCGLAVIRLGRQNGGGGGCSPPKITCFRKSW